MVIKRSSAREVASLLQDLQAGSDHARDAAVARLSVIGTRAVEGVLSLLASTPDDVVRQAALSVLEAVGDPRGEGPAFDWLERGGVETAGAAAGVLRRLLDSPRGTDVLDRLAAIALDVSRGETARLAAVEALRDMPASLTAPIKTRLSDDASARVRAAAAGPVSPEGTAPVTLEEAAAGCFADDPEELRRRVVAEAATAPLPTLHHLIEALRRREDSADAERRRQWMTVRAAVHLALAQRDSTVALYDLRETIESGVQAPVEMLAALEAIGDRTCLEPIAAACARLGGGEAAGADHASDAGAPGIPARDQAVTDWWRLHLVAAFRAIVRREGLTERHAVLRRIRSRWPDSAPLLD